MPLLLILNGTSSSGKSALLAALQDIYPGALLDCGLDKFLWMLPKRFLNLPDWQQVFRYEPGVTPETPIQRIRAGELGNRLVSGMHQAWLALLQSGSHLAADHVLIETAWREELAALFHQQRAYLIKVYCPLPVLEARELSRGNRTLGQARAQYPYVHSPDIYDFAVDTSINSPQQAAAAVFDFIAAAPRPQALRKLYNIAVQTPQVSP